MLKLRAIAFFISLILIPIYSLAQNVLEKMESQVKSAFQKALPASVKLYNYDMLSGNKMFAGSGVVVDSSGLILTVAHVNKPGEMFIAKFPDGREFKVRGLGSISSLDAAMMQIQEEGPFPVAKMGRSAGLKLKQPCIALGYAGSLRAEMPALRFGFVLNKPKESSYSIHEGNRLQTTCLMEPGDSGGPVFDLEGRVIGMRSNIDYPADANFDVPIDVYLEYWDTLKIAKVNQEPDAKMSQRLPITETFWQEDEFIPYSDTTATIIRKFTDIKASSYRIESLLKDDSTITAYATLVSMKEIIPSRKIKNKAFLVSKSSIVGKVPMVSFHNEKMGKATVVYRDKKRDLVLLEVQAKLPGAFDLNNSSDSIAFDGIGTFVLTPLDDKTFHVGVVGSTPFSISPESRAGYLGVGLEVENGQVLLARIDEKSPANHADIPLNSIIVRIDGTDVNSPQRFVELVQKHAPGDSVQIEYSFNGTVNLRSLILGSRPLISGTHIAERFPGGKSGIRDGFPRIFAQDGRLYPQECGSPLVDLRGRLTGVNIARLSRTCTLVLPVDELRSFLSEYADSIAGK